MSGNLELVWPDQLDLRDDHVNVVMLLLLYTVFYLLVNNIIAVVPNPPYLQVHAVYLQKTWAKFGDPYVVSTASVRIWEHADTP